MTSISDCSHLLRERLKTVAYVQFTSGLIRSTGEIELRCTGNKPSRRNVVLLEEFQETWYTYFSSVHSLCTMCMASIVSKPDRLSDKQTNALEKCQAESLHRHKSQAYISFSISSLSKTKDKTYHPATASTSTPNPISTLRGMSKHNTTTSVFWTTRLGTKMAFHDGSRYLYPPRERVIIIREAFTPTTVDTDADEHDLLAKTISSKIGRKPDVPN